MTQEQAACNGGAVWKRWKRWLVNTAMASARGTFYFSFYAKEPVEEVLRSNRSLAVFQVKVPELLGKGFERLQL
jgi:hypothetical protein